MEEKTSFNNEEAVEYLKNHGVIIRRLDFSMIIRTSRIFMSDPGTYKVTPAKSRGGRGYWITSKHALDRYIRLRLIRKKKKEKPEVHKTNLYTIEITFDEELLSEDILKRFGFFQIVVKF